MDRARDNRFVVYDEELRKTLSDAARRPLDQLRDRFHRVELRGMSDQEWCVRVVREDDPPGPLPLAAIGRTPQLAAERLWRISTFYEFTPRR